MDRRLTASNGRVAHVSLRGQVDAARFVDGDWARVTRPVADILDKRRGRRDRQALYGERFLVLERMGGYAFGQAERDGHVGYVDERALGPDSVATHWVSVPATHLYPGPDIKLPEAALLSLGARLTVTGTVDERFMATDQGLYALVPHLSPVATRAKDPVDVAMRLFGTPYLWGGNSRSGIDCSGLMQMAHLACGIPCPPDSDLQEAGLGHPIPDNAPLLRGDLMFWDGHVALAVDKSRLVHAAAYHMAVVVEPVKEAVTRTLARGGGPVTSRRRLGEA